MIFPLVLGLFIFVPSPQTLDKEGFKKEMLFSYSLSAKQKSVPILKQNRRSSLKSTKGLSLLASANADKNDSEVQTQSFSKKNLSEPTILTKQEKINPEPDTKLDIESTKPDTESTKLDTADTKPDTESTKPDIADTKPDTTDTKPDTESTKLDTADTKPDTESTKPDTESTKPDTTDTKPNTTDTKPDTESTKLDTADTKPDTESTKLDTKSTKPDTADTKPDTESTKKPDTESTKLDTADTKHNPSDEMEFLKSFTQEKSSLEIHNKALQFLKANHKEQAVLLLKKNIYQNLFLPSYFVLSHLDIPVFFAPFLWPVSLLFMALICLLQLFLSFKKPSLFHLKTLFWSLSLYSFLIFSGWFFLKKRVSPLQEIDLKSSPFMSAPTQTQLSPNSDLIVLKQTKNWLRIQSSDKQTGWVLKKKVLQIF